MKKDILNKVLEVLSANLENIELTAAQEDADLSALGMDSMAFIRVIVALEDEFSVEFPDEKLLMTGMNTAAKIADVLTAVCNGTHGDSKKNA